MVHNAYKLEATTWQLYDACVGPNINYGAGKLSWVIMNYQLYKPDHGSHDGVQYLEILDERKTVANVGCLWLHTLMGVRLSRHHRRRS